MEDVVGAGMTLILAGRKRREVGRIEPSPLRASGMCHHVCDVVKATCFRKIRPVRAAVTAQFNHATNRHLDSMSEHNCFGQFRLLLLGYVLSQRMTSADPRVRPELYPGAALPRPHFSSFFTNSPDFALVIPTLPVFVSQTPHSLIPQSTMSKFCTVPEAIEAIKNGEFLVVMDDEDRENEGDLIIAAEKTTQEKMAFLVRHTSGYVCAPLSTERADQLDLPPMLKGATDRHGTAYTVTCDFADGTTTGISAHDRALTARLLAAASSKPKDFIRPGHVLPLRAVPGLLKKRRGHTEASVQLCELAGLQPAAVICELVRDEDGLMMRLDDCVKFSQTHGIKVVTIEQLVRHIE